ncbi:MAG: hypothetical protein HYT27_01105 [Parcubacteria group bacterium]|nr:hypothetical protein [Parcubacteria group bacterium]
MESQTKVCQNCKGEFIIDASDFEFYEKFGASEPKYCPDCRFRIRCLFRNEKSLYSRKCDKCGVSIISMYNPKLPYVVYCVKCWDSDTWDPYDYGIDYDPKKPFFKQVGELFKRVPKKATYVSTSGKYGPNINSDYTNVSSGNKNCYLIFNSSGCEEAFYSRGIVESRDVSDLYFGINLERCYEGINIDQCANVQYAQNVVGSIDSQFLLNASGLQNCFGCVNLRHKSYHFFNEPLSKEEYQKKVSAIRGSYQKTEEAKKAFAEFSLKFPRRKNNNIKTVDSIGDYLFECKNLVQCFEATRAEDSKYCFSVKFLKDSYDVIGYGYDSELLLECVGVGLSSRVVGSYWVSSSHDIDYSYCVESSEYCFGCDGLRHARYSILNKRYTKEEYEKLRETIIAELQVKGLYGSFFPPEIAPAAYNESIGQENLPLTPEEAIKMGFRWEENLQMTKGKETMRPEDIPDHINDVKDSITNEVLACVSCSRNYRITPAELELYRKIIVPLPRRCFNCRYLERIRARGPFTVYDRTCAKCHKPIKTSFNPNLPEIVYCEQCYQAEVV